MENIKQRIFDKTCEVERLTWLGALFTAIQADVTHHGGRNAQDLADVGKYLAAEFEGNTSRDIDDLTQTLEG